MRELQQKILNIFDKGKDIHLCISDIMVLLNKDERVTVLNNIAQLNIFGKKKQPTKRGRPLILFYRLSFNEIVEKERDLTYIYKKFPFYMKKTYGERDQNGYENK